MYNRTEAGCCRGTWDNGSDLSAISFVPVPTAAYACLNQGEHAILVSAMKVAWPKWWNHSDRYQKTVLTWTMWRVQIKYGTWLYKSLSFVVVVVGVTEYVKVDHLQLWDSVALSLKSLGRHIFRLFSVKIKIIITKVWKFYGSAWLRTAVST